MLKTPPAQNDNSTNEMTDSNNEVGSTKPTTSNQVDNKFSTPTQQVKQMLQIKTRKSPSPSRRQLWSLSDSMSVYDNNSKETVN